MEKKLIPYSVYLPEPIFDQLKQAARLHKASKIVRNAVIAYLDESNPRAAGYAEGISDAIQIVQRNKAARSISYNGDVIADAIITKLETLRGRNEEKRRTARSAQTRPAAAD
jgi:metal-responsive CopG/Arc/MetJ family transcriptional regulator